MKVVQGKKVCPLIIKQWIKTVNAEYGLSDKDEAAERFFLDIKDSSIFILDDDLYAVLAIGQDPWGNKEMYVVSFYIRKERRNFKTLMKLQRMIEGVARKHGCRFLIHGSHLEERFFKFLQYTGYKVATMKKELEYGWGKSDKKFFFGTD